MKLLNAYVIAIDCATVDNTVQLKVPTVFFNPADALKAAKNVPGVVIMRISVSLPEITP